MSRLPAKIKCPRCNKITLNQGGRNNRVICRECGITFYRWEGEFIIDSAWLRAYDIDEIIDKFLRIQEAMKRKWERTHDSY